MSENEAALRAAMQRAYDWGGGYPDPGVTHRLVAGVHQPSGGHSLLTRLAGLAVGVAVVTVGVVAILTLLSTRQAAGGTAQPATKPSPLLPAIVTKQAFLLLGLNGGQLSLDGTNLPPNSAVTVAVQQGSVPTEVIATKADARGVAHAMVPFGAYPPGATMDFAICVTAAATPRSCVVEQLTIPAGGASASGTSPGCPPGMRVTSRSTPGAGGDHWLACFGIPSTQSPP